MTKVDFDNFIPKSIQDFLCEYFSRQGFDTHMREWNIQKVPGLNEFNIEIKLVVNKKES